VTDRRGVAINRLNRPYLQATLLTVVAGIADAVGYITMGGVFAANMTGNTVLAGIALAEGHTIKAGHLLAPLLAFFFGALLAYLLERLWHKRSIALIIEALLIAVVGFLPIGIEPAVLVLALAMGVQANAITHFAGEAISTVVVTSTLARTAEAALDLVWKPEKPAPSAAPKPRLLALTWTGYLVGAIAGGLLLHLMPYPLLVPAALLVLVIFL
jgi:uncharacterized membrane protein YoaK (UPF0700 family)